MITDVTTCHAPAPEPPVPAALAGRPLAALPGAADTLLACHAHDAATALGGAPAARKAVTPRKPASTGPGWAAATAGTTKTGTTKAGTSAASTAAKSKASSTTAAKSATPSALAFLDDKNLSVEDKLLKLLAYLDKKWESDIDKKMKEAANLASSSGSGGSGSASGGVLGAISPFVSGVKSMSGPLMAASATALGFPELAPLAAKWGPTLVDGAVSLASTSGALPGATGSTSSSGSTSSAQGSDREAQLKLMEIQRVIDQQKEMFSLVSNLLRSRHETRMGVIQNWK